MFMKIFNWFLATQESEYKPRITIHGAGYSSVKSKDIVKTKQAQRQINALRKLIDNGMLVK